MTGRNPYSPIKFENDLTLSGYKPKEKRNFDKPTHLAQTEEPWSRLYDSATCSSFRRSATYYDQQAPRDSLDFQLRTVYDHHRDFFWSKNQILYQKDTLCEIHTEKMQKTQQDQEVRRWVDPQRLSIYSCK
uniref:Si:ch211-163l21.7 n=1 Tax=Neogobius melanostomus TaxID=47308 RepID=A0A8C6TAG6_9GOBI